jgi:hypothetical protein
VGLDLTVEGCAKPGFEPEWRRLLQRSFAGEELSNGDTARFQEISVPGYQRLGAPQVGFDSAADAWIIEKRKAETPADRTAVLREFHGYYVLRLAQCDGGRNIPTAACTTASTRQVSAAIFSKVVQMSLARTYWTTPGTAKCQKRVAYGRGLLAAADAAEAAGRAPQSRTSFLSRIGLTRASAPIPIAEQLNIVRAAGRWFIFWGERGHPIHAYF